MAGTVSIDITASNQKALAAINQTNQALGGMGKAAQQSATSLGNIEKGLAWAGRLTAIAAGGAAVTAAIRKVTDAASDLQQSEGAVEAVFGDMSGAVAEIEAAAEAANDLGLSTAEFNQTAAQMGGMLKNLGIESQAVAGVTTDLIGLSADLAAVFGTDLAQATGAVQAALRGEFDPLEKFSVSLKKSTVDAYAAANGISAAAATIELLKQQSADYAGQRESEAGTFAVAEEKMQAALTDTYAIIGGALLPAMTALTSSVGVLASAFGSIPAPVLDFAAKIAMIAAAGKLLLFITPKLVGAFRALGGALLSTVSPAAAIATSMDGKLTPAMERAEKRAKALKGALKQVGAALAIMAAYKTVEFLNEAMEEAVGTTEEWAKAWADLNAASRGSSLADQVEEVANLSRQGDFGLKQQALQLQENQGLYESAAIASKNFWELNVTEAGMFLTRWKDAGAQVEAAKNGLEELAATNPQAAVEQWRAFEAVLQGAGMDPSTYQDTKDAIEEAARAAGYSADAFSENATKLDELRTAYDEASKAAKNFKSDMDALFADLDVDVAVEKYTNGLKELAATDFNKANDAQAIKELSTSWQAVSQSMIQAGADTADVGRKYDQMRNQAKRALEDIGITGKRQKEILDAAFGDPALVKARWDGQDDVDAAQGAIDGVEQGTPPGIDVNTDPANNALTDLLGRLTNLGKRAFTTTIDVVIQGLTSLPSKVLEWLGRSAPLPPDPTDDVVGIMAATTRAKKNSGKGGADVTVVVGVEFDVDQTRALAGLSASWEDVTESVADYEQAVNNLSDTTGRIRELSKELKGAKGDDKKSISKDIKEAAREAFTLAKGLGLAEGKAKKFVAQINKASGKQALKLFDALEASFTKTKKAADQARAVFAGWQQIANSVASTFEQAFNPGAALSQLKSDLATVAADTKKAYEDAVAARDDLLDDPRRTSWNPFERQAWQQDFNALQAAVKEAEKAQTSGTVSGSKLSAELRKQAQQAKQFAARLKQLKAAGLSGESLQELSGMGVEAGNEFAAALLDPLTGPQLRQAMNDTQSAIAEAGKTAGTAVADANLAAVRQGIKDAAELERKWFKKNPLEIETKLNIKLSRKQKKALKKLGVDVSGMAAPAPAQVTINVTADGDGEAIARKVEDAWRSIERREKGLVFN